MRMYYLIAYVFLFAACGTSDTTPPAPPIVDPITSPNPNTIIDVTGTAEFSSTVTIRGGTSVQSAIADPYTARWFAKVTLAPGLNQLAVTAEDRAGNVSDPTLVDVTQGPLGTVAPYTLALQLAQPSAFVGIPLGFSVIAVDARGNPADQSTLAITSTDPGASISLPNRTITFDAAGTPAHTVTATLFSGTADEVSASATLFVSAITNRPPTIAIISPATNLTFGDDFTVTVRASSSSGLAQIYLQATGAVDTFQQQLVPLDSSNNPPLGPYDAVFTVSVPGDAIGPATLVAQATDIYGNAMTSAAVTVNIDPARRIITGGGVTVSTLSARGLLRRPQGIAVDASFVYVTNNNDAFPLVVRIDPMTGPLTNQSTLVTPQPNHDGQDIVYVDGGTPALFVSTTGINRIARVDVAGTNLLLAWSQSISQPFGLAVESSSRIAAIYGDQRVRRFNPTALGPNVAPSSSMDASVNLAGAWGLEVLNVGCQADQFRCGNGNCIANVLACNSVDNCGDNTDEGTTTCAAPATFRCTSGAVASTPVSNICSGQSECADNSDEAGCSRYAVSDAGANDDTWSFYDGGNAVPTAFDLLLNPVTAIADPRGIARSPSGAFVYIASRGSNAIYQISNDDILARTPCAAGCPTVATGFNEAYGLAFANNGDLLVSDRGDNIVYRIAGLP